MWSGGEYGVRGRKQKRRRQQQHRSESDQGRVANTRGEYVSPRVAFHHKKETTWIHRQYNAMATTRTGKLYLIGLASGASILNNLRNSWSRIVGGGGGDTMIPAGLFRII